MADAVDVNVFLNRTVLCSTRRLTKRPLLKVTHLPLESVHMYPHALGSAVDVDKHLVDAVDGDRRNLTVLALEHAVIGNFNTRPRRERRLLQQKKKWTQTTLALNGRE